MNIAEPVIQSPRRRRLLLWAAAIAGAFVVFLWIATPHLPMEESASYTRPDGKYRIVVFRIPVWLAMMPGQGSDAPGVVRLYDQQGKLLHETKVEMVQLVDHVDWGPKKVEIKLIADWDLPD
jgi:hypothetical protein